MVKDESVTTVVGEVRVLPWLSVSEDPMEKEDAVVDGDGLERIPACWLPLIAWLVVTLSCTLISDECVGRRDSGFRCFSISAVSPKMNSKVVA